MFVPPLSPSFLSPLLPLTVADEINLTPRPETNTGKDWCTERWKGKKNKTELIAIITISFWYRGVKVVFD